MKLIKKILFLIIVLIVLAVLGRNFIVKYGAPIGARVATGVNMSIGKVDIALTKAKFGINDIVVKNPSGFPKGNMADVKEIYLDCRPLELLKDKIYVNEVRFNLDKIEIVKNKDGDFNFDKLTKAKNKKEGKPEEKPKQKKKGKKKEIQIDTLKLKIGKVVYKDYSKGDTPKVTEFNINLDREYKNITNPAMIGSLIFSEIMMNTTLSGLTGLDMGAINDALDINADDLKSIQNNLLGKENAEKLNDAVNKAADSLKKLF